MIPSSLLASFAIRVSSSLPTNSQCSIGVKRPELRKYPKYSTLARSLRIFLDNSGICPSLPSFKMMPSISFPKSAQAQPNDRTFPAPFTRLNPKLHLCIAVECYWCAHLFQVLGCTSVHHATRGPLPVSTIWIG